MMDVEGAISKMKNRFGVTTDSDLAEALCVSKQTVSSWRSRESVPEDALRYARALFEIEARVCVTVPILGAL
ncbi:helix-turn-helix domain-containing protein [uncultured Mameliella sp.]|uniref:helix-turn-helix domain-containing protein n=1 Tax=uncultured Mameliella sp. TaxID=1447087 RepID=UPI0026155E54|nr:helix-turn-helix domain-containing protein [uncultured Mameliella sp.]